MEYRLLNKFIDTRCLDDNIQTEVIQLDPNIMYEKIITDRETTFDRFIVGKTTEVCEQEITTDMFISEITYVAWNKFVSEVLVGALHLEVAEIEQLMSSAFSDKDLEKAALKAGELFQPYHELLVRNPETFTFFSIDEYNPTEEEINQQLGAFSELFFKILDAGGYSLDFEDYEEDTIESNLVQ